MEQKLLLKALNAYADKIKIGDTDAPIVFRRVRLDDELINDNLITDLSIHIDDIDERIENGCFESGNYFSLTQDGAFVYCKERISRNIHSLFFIISKKELDNAMRYHREIKSKLLDEVKYLKTITQKTSLIILDIESALDNP